MKFALLTVLMMNGTASDPVSTSQAWREFPTQETCIAARDAVTTGDRIIDQGLKRIAVTLVKGSPRQEVRREGTCVPTE